MTVNFARIGDIAEQVRGVSYSKADASKEPKAESLPILRAGNITEHGLKFHDLVYVPRAKIADRQLIRRHDVVIAASSGSIDVVGKAAQSREQFLGSFGAFCKVLRPSARVDPDYFAHFFKTAVYRRKVSEVAAGININNLRNRDLDDLQIPLPPLPEQKRIAKILDAADALRAKRRESLAQLDALLQSTFLEMFGDPVENPKGWDLAPLSALGKITTGKTPPTKQDGMFGGEIPFATPSDLDCALATTARTITDQGASYTTIVRPGSSLVGCIGNIGKMAMSPVHTAFNQQINAIEWNERIDDNFGLTALKHSVPEMLAKASSTTVPILNKTGFSSISIIVPPIENQHKFASLVRLIHQNREFLQAQFAELETLFLSLQQRAFAGAL